MRAIKKLDQADQNKVLAELRVKIEAHRKRHPKQARLPKKIRSLVLRLLGEGASSNQLGVAIGMSGRAIRYWQKLDSKLKNKQTKKLRVFKSSVKLEESKKNKFVINPIKPRQLSVTDEREVGSFSQGQAPDRVKASVLLCSGVRIEIELSALDSDFLFRLNQIGGV